MEINDTSCCAVGDIDGLSHHDSAEDAMLNFCRNFADVEEPDWWNNPNGKGRYRGLLTEKLGGHYIFTGVVNHGERYGQAFKAYILRHGLGTVSESRGAFNRVNHPNNKVKVWVWQPSIRGLKSWARKHKDQLVELVGW